MLKSLTRYKTILDYLPIILITLLFVAETELENHALHTTCQLSITIVTLGIFYIVILKLGNTKTVAFLAALIAWIILIYIKKKYVI